MTDKKINLTALIVMKEIEDFLMASDHPVYQVFFSSLPLRNQLITRVLACIPHRYKVVKSLQALTDNSLNCSHTPLQERLLIEDLISQIISTIILESYQEINPHKLLEELVITS
ncbi:MAG: hypothetical protein WBA13_16115 [Microcoleaceae cyanobacterium]